MNASSKLSDFQKTILPHLDAAYRLARWLMANDQDAEDVAQDACLRAWRFYSGFRGGDGRVWLLAIVRNTAFTRLAQKRGKESDVAFDEEMHSAADPASSPAALAVGRADREAVRSAIAQLPPEFREIITLRELEDLSYKEIAGIADIPIGTVMSRLARGRALLHEHLAKIMQPGGEP
ncbi:MAG: sigma-70 family RNA polymerase sigma factor [Terrimicrobiaceae bacterium]|nr:sigma-70 family RNA polymerase sigma factor [Terrimicrobiaceae bacterium]